MSSQTPASKSQIRAARLLNVSIDSSDYPATGAALEAAGVPADGLPAGETWRSAGKLDDATLIAHLGKSAATTHATVNAEFRAAAATSRAAFEAEAQAHNGSHRAARIARRERAAAEYANRPLSEEELDGFAGWSAMLDD